jgi:acetylornithine deacetylase/succinyl-diaminopimelate desuccinylase-like protein
MDAESVVEHVARVWDESAVPALTDYIRIPNLSPAFDPDWAAHGHMEQAIQLVTTWMRARPIAGLQVTVERLEDRTPVILAEVPSTGTAQGTVVLYGHVDKQPEMSGWRDGLGPWTPVRDGDRLYGRGGADDGYAAFAALGAIEALQAAGGSHARLVVVIEASEESGSPDLPAYIEALAPRIGEPELVICLDSGCPTWDRLWLTTSLRGLLALTVTVRVLEEGVHSGAAGGVVPSTFRILRQLLSRLEDETTGEMLLPELHVEMPVDREKELTAAASELGADISERFPFVAGALPRATEAAAQLRAKTWEPALEVIGLDGVPAVADGGNVLRPFTTARLSFRLPPTCPAEPARDAIVRALTSDPPHGAAIEIDDGEVGGGWNAPPTAPWLADAVDEASHSAFGEPARLIGEGGSIPFMGMLGQRFPDAQFVITGVLGPETNAHGPNEFLHLPTAQRISIAVAHLLDAHARR